MNTKNLMIQGSRLMCSLRVQRPVTGWIIWYFAVHQHIFNYMQPINTLIYVKIMDGETKPVRIIIQKPDKPVIVLIQFLIPWCSQGSNQRPTAYEAKVIWSKYGTF